MEVQVLDEAVEHVLSVMPDHANALARLKRLITAREYPTVTVIGKYNHGKSRLLNELIGNDIFSVADKRETITLLEYMHNHVRWLDAPGLDADVAEVDDQHAFNAVWIEADIRLFIHSVTEGELDAAEQQLLNELKQDIELSHRQTLLILTQIDQMPDQDTLAHIQQSILDQVPSLNVLPVSATRHRQGIDRQKPLLVEKSGLLALQEALQTALEQVASARQFEKETRFNAMQQQLDQLQFKQYAYQKQLQQTQVQQLQEFENGLIQVLDKIRVDLEPIINITGEDQALQPDSFATMFKNTQAKQQRAKVQIAYSKACIDINSHLIRHGVVGLPEDQQTHVKSLDTVIVAVLGISVKFREQLKNIFYSDLERARLKREFCFYFEKSAVRQDLVAQLTQIDQQLKQITLANLALKKLEEAA